jgi:hypothetical protein
MRPLRPSLVALALSALTGAVGCGPSRATIPSPPRGWVMVSEESAPSPDEVETPRQVIDELVTSLEAIPGAVKQVQRGERWAVLDIDAARTAEGMSTSGRGASATPAQLRLFVSGNPDGTFTITQTMYAPPQVIGSTSAAAEPAPSEAAGARSGPPAPPDGWNVVNSFEEPFPTGRGFETPEQIIDGLIMTMQRIPGAISDVRRGDGWAVIDADGALMHAGMGAKAPSEPPDPWPTQLHIRVWRGEDGQMMIKQTFYGSPEGDR